MPTIPSIPVANVNHPIARNIVKQFASNGFVPVIALEAFVEAGRTYQAYKRGGFDEARERITEEFSGAVFWLGGVTGLNWLFEKLGQKMLKLPKETVDIASDHVRNPLETYLEKEVKTDGTSISRKLMSRFKFAKVISSVLIANAFIGFVLPKINQAITRSYHKNKPVENPAFTGNDSFIKRPDLDMFAQGSSADKKDVSFKGKLDLLAIANNFENKRNWKLLSVDVGTCSGRVYSARNNDERVEIGFRDIASIYFYMFNMNNMNKWLNKIEQNGIATRLDPVSAEFATKYMNSYLGEDGKVSVAQFEKDMLGANKELPSEVKAKFKDGKIITLEDFKASFKTSVPAEKIKEIEQIAEKMSTLQPQIKGKSILTEGQVKDILNGGYINNPEFLKEFYKNSFGKKFMQKYKYVAQNDIDAVKEDLTNYVKSIIKKAKESGAQEITSKMLRKASNHNLKMNAINWGTGFAISAAFLSTIIPKVQYFITKYRTGEDAFPGTQQYRKAA